MSEETKIQERKFQLEQMKIQLLHDAFNSIMSALITVSTSASIALIAIIFTVDLQESVKTILSIFAFIMGIIFAVVGVSFVLITFIYFPRRIDKLNAESTQQQGYATSDNAEKKTPQQKPNATTSNATK